ncbi:unnamed protein product [Closterium sp. NIES-53]
MVGSVRNISNISRAPAAYVTVANNEQLRASAQGIVVLQARDSNTHITFNDVLYVPNLRFNLLSAGQLKDCGLMLATDPYTHDLILTYAPPDTPVELHKYIGRARSLNGVYVLDFNIPNCKASPDELVDLVPLDFPYMNVESWQHPDGRPWICCSPHPQEINLHQPGPDELCTTCLTPTASRTEEVEKVLAAIQKDESTEAEPEGMTKMELAITTHHVFRTGNERIGLTEQERPTPRTETLRWILEDAHATTFDEENRPRPYPCEVYHRIDTAWKDPDAPEELSVKEEEEKSRAERKQKLYQERIATGWDEESARRGAWGDDDGTIQGWETGERGDAERRELAEGDLTQEEMK